MIICTRKPSAAGSPSVIIREIEQKDIRQVLEIFGTAGFHNNENCSLVVSLVEFHQQIVAEMIKSRKIATVLVAEVNNRIVGYASLCVDVPRLWIAHMAVAPDSRNQGYGCLLLASARHIAAEEGFELSALMHGKAWLMRRGFASHDDEARGQILTFNDKHINGMPPSSKSEISWNKTNSYLMVARGEFNDYMHGHSNMYLSLLL